MSKKSTLACYYFPDYHPEPRNDQFRGAGWTEWQLVRYALPRYPGHRQPLVPAWGYEDESKPAVMSKKIAAAADHGIDAFIFDWYWYNEKPYLHRALEEGYFGASNRERLRFAIMWANHDWTDCFPGKMNQVMPVLFPAQMSMAAYGKMCDYLIAKYFHHPQYWKINGCPYFSIFELKKLVEVFGSIEQARAAMRLLREKTRAAGFPDLHLNFIVYGVALLAGTGVVKDAAEVCRQLECDSVTSYSLVHNVFAKGFPTGSYNETVNGAPAYWRQADKEFPVPSHPNVTMGWDSSPRCVQTDGYVQNGYPYCQILVDNTPAAFEKLLHLARRHLDSLPEDRRILTINAWNEWTEGSYLEPDTKYGMGYLEAIKKVFGGPDA